MFIIGEAIAETLFGCMQTSRLFHIFHKDKFMFESLPFVPLPAH